MVYFLFLDLVPVVNEVLNRGDIQASFSEHNWELFWRLVLCVPSLFVIILSCWRFREMPIFSVVVGLLAGWHIYTALELYFRYGFDNRIPMNIYPLGFLITALIALIPFALVYGIVVLLGRLRARSSTPHVE